MQRVLVGVDGSTTGASAAVWSARLAKATGAELIAVTAWRPDQAEIDPDEMETLRAAAEDRLATAWSDPIRQMGVTPRTIVTTGGVDRLLVAAAEQDVDLVVVGTHGHGGFAPRRFGSNAHHLAHHTRRPLALVPPDVGDAADPSGRIGRIVVCVDDSEGAAAAIGFTADVAKALGAEVTALATDEPFLEWVPETDPRSWHVHLERQAKEWVRPIVDAGVATDVVVKRDLHPAHALLAAAKDAQLLVVASAGLNSVLKVRLGGTAMEVIDGAAIPVVIVPPKWTGADETAGIETTTDQDDAVRSASEATR